MYTWAPYARVFTERTREARIDGYGVDERPRANTRWPGDSGLSTFTVIEACSLTGYLSTSNQLLASVHDVNFMYLVRGSVDEFALLSLLSLSPHFVYVIRVRL